jgi:L-aspartate oxidase
VSEAAAGLEKADGKIEIPAPVFINPENESTFLQYKNEIAGLMSANVAIVRTRLGLEQAKEKLEDILVRFDDFKDEYNFLKIKNAAVVSLLITKAALAREESRGCHIREDFKKTNPDFEVHFVQQKGFGLSSEKVQK